MPINVDITNVMGSVLLALLTRQPMLQDAAVCSRFALPLAVSFIISIPRAITTVWLVVFYVLQFVFTKQCNLDLY
jgi:hypothetical protein